MKSVTVRAFPWLQALLAAAGLAAWTPAVPAQADTDKIVPLRYLKPAEGKFVLESEISGTKSDDKWIYSSRTERGPEKMTLTLTYDKGNTLTRAEATLDNGMTKQTALVVFDKNGAQLKRPGGVTDLIKITTAPPVVTTAPDWSDIFQLARNYDRRRGGKQSFPGLWIHPSRPYQVLTFTIERLGEDSLTLKERKIALDRYRVTLRSGDYTVWADAAGLVYKLVPAGKPDDFVVLEGYEEVTRGLVAP
jgi:hypothetical protein